MDKNRIAEIVEKAKSGNSDAFSQLFELTQHKAYYTAIKITKNPEDAQDILQDSYEKAFTSLNSLKDNSKFQSWFNCIVANNCRNYVVKKKPNLFSEYENDEEDVNFEDSLENNDISLLPHEVTDNQETKRLVMKCIDQLPEDQRICVLMFYYDEMSINEIAQVLDISEGTVKSRLSTAKKKLKKEFKKLEEDGTKLYGVPFVPLIRWAFKFDSSENKISKLFLGKMKKSVLGFLKNKNILSLSKTFLTSILGNKAVVGILSVAVISAVIAGGISVYNNLSDKNDKEVMMTTEYSQPTDTQSNSNIQNENFFYNGDFAVYDKEKNNIYYLTDNSVVKANYNGNNEEIILDNKSYNLVYTNKLYFVSDNTLYSFDNNKIKKLFSVKSSYIYAYENELIGISRDKSKAYIIDLDDNTEKEININGNNIIFENNYLYYRGLNQNIYRISPNKQNETETAVNYSDENNINLPYYIIGNTAYYSDFSSDETGIIYSSNIGSDVISKINLGSGVIDFSVTDNSVYYSDSERKLYKFDRITENKTLISKGDFGYSCSSGKYQIWYDTSAEKSYIICDEDSSFYKTFDGCISDAQIIDSSIYYRIDGHIYHSSIDHEEGD